MHGCGRDEAGPWAPTTGGTSGPSCRLRGGCRLGGSYGRHGRPIHGCDLRCCLLSGGRSGCFCRGPAAPDAYGARRAARASHNFRLGLAQPPARAPLSGHRGPGLDNGPCSSRPRTGHFLPCRRGSGTCRRDWKEASAKTASYSRRSGGVSTEAYHQRHRAARKAEATFDGWTCSPDGNTDGS